MLKPSLRNESKGDTCLFLRNFFLSVGLSLFIVLSPLNVLVAQGPSQTHPESLFITSQKMVTDVQENKVVFEGDVTAKKDDFTLHADRLDVFFAEQSEMSRIFDENTEKTMKGSSQGEKQIKRIEARGHVSFHQKGRKGTSQKATYYEKEGKIILEGSPVVHEEDYDVRGDTMTIFLKENKNVVARSRVKITPK